MPSYTDNCTVCGKSFRNSTTEHLQQCSVACALERAQTITMPEWDGKCCVCHDRPGTETVYGCPGGISHWCPQCCGESQLKGARESAARIPALEAELERLKKGQS